MKIERNDFIFENYNRIEKFKKIIYPYLWLLPAILIMVLILGYPWFFAIIRSFFHWNPVRNPIPNYVGLKNYVELFNSTEFWISLRITIIFLILTVGGQMTIGISLALLLQKKLFGRKFFLGILIVPMMLTPSVVGLMWKLILHSVWGIIPYIFFNLGLPSIGWLSDPSFGLITVSLIEIWRETSFVLLIVFAALEAIPQELTESASLDGANEFQIIHSIKIPYIKPVLFTVFIFRFVSTFRSFAVIFSLYKAGGPGNSAKVIGVFLYDYFRKSWELGAASSIAIILVLFTLVLMIYPIKKSFDNTM